MDALEKKSPKLARLRDLWERLVLVPWVVKKFFIKTPDKKFGVRNLEQRATFVEDPEALEHVNEHLKHHADIAQETLTLYRWWTEVRPNRPDAHDASGLTAWYANEKNSKKNVFEKVSNDMYQLVFKGTLEEEQDYNQMSKLRIDIEEKYEKEDEEMLIRLMKIRRSLWT